MNELWVYILHIHEVAGLLSEDEEEGFGTWFSGIRKAKYLK